LVRRNSYQKEEGKREKGIFTDRANEIILPKNLCLKRKKEKKKKGNQLSKKKGRKGNLARMRGATLPFPEKKEWKQQPKREGPFFASLQGTLRRRKGKTKSQIKGGKKRKGKEGRVSK